MNTENHEIPFSQNEYPVLKRRTSNHQSNISSHKKITEKEKLQELL